MSGQVYPIRCRIRAGDDGGVTRVDVYDDIGPGGWFSDGFTAKDFAAQLAGVTGALEVHVNSAGGDVFDGIAIANSIRCHRGPVKTVVDGLAASIASVIAQAGQERVMQPGSMMMIHDAFGLAVGNEAEVRRFADTLGQVSDNIAAIYAEHAGGSQEQWRGVMRGEAWYTAEQAVGAGLADRVGDGGAELPAGFDVAAYAVPGRIAAALRALPRAAAVPHGPMTGTHSHAHPAYGSQGGDATHDHEHTHGGDNGPDANHGHGHGGDAEDRGGRPVNAPGKPFEPEPYHRDPDETVQCPVCKKFNDLDAEFCDQCGTKLAGRTDVEETAGPGQPAQTAAAGNRAGRILGIESMPLLDKAIPVHHTATVDTPWDGPAAVAAMPAEYATLHYCHAWQTADADASSHTAGDDDADDKKSSYKFPHHAKDGGPANLAACRNGLARLSGADIPAGDEAGVKAHLQAHLDDGSDDHSAGDHAHLDLSGVDLEQLGSALKGAFKS